MSGRACIVRVSGRVQQVGFRMWTYRQAQRLGVHGWVRNLPDGRVEACLAADPEILEQMLAILRQGPPLARIDAVERRDIALSEEPAGFDIRE